MSEADGATGMKVFVAGEWNAAVLCCLLEAGPTGALCDGNAVINGGPLRPVREFSLRTW